MLLTVFTSSGRAGGGGSGGGSGGSSGGGSSSSYRWHTPNLDGRAAVIGVAGSFLASLLAALCSFGALGDSCSLSYYWVLPLSNAAFAVCVALCVGWRWCVAPVPSRSVRAVTLQMQRPAGKAPPAVTSTTSSSSPAVACADVELIRRSHRV